MEKGRKTPSGLRGRGEKKDVMRIGDLMQTVAGMR